MQPYVPDAYNGRGRKTLELKSAPETVKEKEEQNPQATTPSDSNTKRSLPRFKTMAPTEEETIKRVYYDEDNGLGSITDTWLQAKRKDKSITPKDANEY